LLWSGASSYGLEAGFDQLSDGFDAAGQAVLGTRSSIRSTSERGIKIEM
jgi:hypothetical protein